MTEGGFCWYELCADDGPAVEGFFAKVAGWTMRDSGMPGVKYTLATLNDVPVAGIMTLPDDAKAAGGKATWLGYVATADVDATAGRLRDAGGRVLRPAQDIPGIGRFAVVADPQGAAFCLFKGQGEPPPASAPGTPGTFGWHELNAVDWPAAFDFYARLFGWTKDQAVDMGEMGTYQCFAIGGTAVGGMMTAPQPPAPSWLYYVNVEDIDAAASRVGEAGGTVIQGPHQVPGGSWIVQARDPQGTAFALAGPRR